MIRSGTVSLPYYDPMTGVMGTWDLGAGTGLRSYVSPDIPLATWGGAPFSSPPNVVLSLAGIEATGGKVRVFLTPQNVQAEEFNIRVEVSDDCTLSSLLVTWLATDAV
ncbi:H-type lectin domain-containing protein [Microbacterium sp. 2FI]|uniref:H-type lectin domain-containing protein n=1 Tax=Microbacterium sp. 2FI TaxID=2502193 RepID=UPI0010F558F3|nr:H-type lectin domain-containing protein [Microbacterium sp. 2FI]